MGPDAYQIGEELARRGDGRIVRARDLRLGRPVAIKELVAADAEAEARFEREALISARLQHPAIIPVYESGRWPDGRPFYAMKLLSGGRPFDAVVAAATPRQRLALIPKLIAVAEALAYAHDRRIFHGHLGPDSVLVGDYGETVVTDWGRGGELASDQEVAGDVHALGSLLEQLLGNDGPRELLTIAGRARDGGYPTAKELAADLRRFQTGQLVSAHHYSAWALLRRFVGRNRGAVRVAAVLLIALAAVVVVGLRRLFAARDQAEISSNIAQLNRGAAEELVQFVLTDVRMRLDNLGKLDLLEGIGLEVEGYYEKLGTPDGDSMLRFSKGLDILGDVKLDRGDLDGALALYRRSLAIRSQLGRLVAPTQIEIGGILWLKGDAEGAEARYRAVVSASEAHPSANMDDRHALALAHLNLGDISLSRGRLDHALAEVQIACDLLRRIIAERPYDSLARLNLAACEDKTGDILGERGDRPGTLAAYQAALAVREKIRLEHPDMARVGEAMAVSRDRIGEIELATGNPTAALATFHAGLELRRKLVDNDRTVARYQRGLSVSFQNLGNAHAALGQRQETLAAYRESLELTRELAQRDPRNLLGQDDLATALYQVGDAEVDLGDTAAAIDFYRQGQVISEELARKEPGNLEWQRNLVTLYDRMAEFHMTAGRPDEAFALYEKERASAERLLAVHPGERGHQLDLAQVYAQEAAIRLRQHRRGPARALALKSRQLLAPLEASGLLTAVQREQAREIDLIDKHVLAH